MTTPSRVTETVPDSIRAREASRIPHMVDVEPVRAPVDAAPASRLAGDRFDVGPPAARAGARQAG